MYFIQIYSCIRILIEILHTRPLKQMEAVAIYFLCRDIRTNFALKI